MAENIHGKMYDMVNRINKGGCRLVFPYTTAEPIKAIFKDVFTGAEWLPTYPNTFHVYGEIGHIAISMIRNVEQIAKDRFVITYGQEEAERDILVQLTD